MYAIRSYYGLVAVALSIAALFFSEVLARRARERVRGADAARS